MKTSLKKLYLVTILLLITALAIAFMARHAMAQQYFTNNGAAGNTQLYGAAQYNQNYGTPLFPSQTLAHQYADGILAGTAGPVSTVLVTNTFGTNIYSQPPFVTANASITNCQVAINSVTTSNVVFQTSAVSVTLYWIAVGH
jgi:hypothetical protein